MIESTLGFDIVEPIYIEFIVELLRISISSSSPYILLLFKFIDLINNFKIT